MKRLISLGFLATVLTGCVGDSEFRPVGPGPDIGDLFPRSAPAQPAQPQQNVPGTAASKMLQNPEGQSWDEPTDIYAYSPEEARRECEKIAANRSVGDTIVTCLGCKQMTLGSNRRAARHSCTMRVEVAAK